jgi:O-antigen/teichoic acid export membrane protein
LTIGLKQCRLSLASAARWLTSGRGSLRERTARGGIWLTLGDAATSLSGLVKVAILGRLLSPADFGLLGIALLVQSWIDSFTQTGTSAALIQKRVDIHPFLNTAWTVQIVRGFMVAALVFLLAPFGAWFFGNPGVVPLIRAAALLTLMWEFTNPAVIYLRKDLDFRQDVIWRASGVLPGLVTGVALALVYRSVWALMASLLVARLAEVAASYWIQPYCPRLAFEWRHARELMRFGKWVSWLNIGGFLEGQMDSLLTGRLLGAISLGYYQVARQIATALTAKISSCAYALLFPAFSKVESLARLCRPFLATLRILLVMVVPLGCLLSAFAEPLVRVILGSRWLVICPVLQVLTWAGVATAVAGSCVPVFLSSGRPHWATLAQWLKVALLALLLYPLMKSLGLMGVALALTAAAVVSMVVQLVVVGRLLKAGLMDTVRTCGPAALGSAPFILAWLLSLGRATWIVYLAVVLAGVIYLAVLITTFRSQLGGAAGFGGAGRGSEAADRLPARAACSSSRD